MRDYITAISIDSYNAVIHIVSTYRISIQYLSIYLSMDEWICNILDRS